MKKLYLLLFGGIMFMTACKKEIPKVDPSSNLNALASNKSSLASYPGSVAVQDGRLTFANYASFNNLMQQAFADSSINEIRAAIAATPGGSGFVSYASRGSAETVLNGPTPPPSRPMPYYTDLEQDTLIDDIYFAEVLNTNGELQVENTIYKVTPNGTFAIVPSYMSQFNTMLDANGMLISPYKTALTTIDGDNGFYKVNDNVYLLDTYGIIRTGQGGFIATSRVATGGMTTNGARPCRDAGCSTVPAGYINTLPFGNIDTFPFNGRYTIAGKLLQDIFGDPVYKYFNGSRSTTRLKVNFYSKNWLVFASVGVRAVIQKKTSFIGLSIWGPVANKDEMRIGWTPIIMKLDLPAFTKPNTTAPQDPYTVAGKIAKNSVKIILGDDEFTGLKVEDILDANYAFPFLTGTEINKLNSLTLFDVNASIQNQANSEIDNLIKKVKAKLNYTAPTNKIAFIKDVQIIAEGGVRIHKSNEGNGVMSKTFNFATAEVGFSSIGGNSNPIFKPAKTIEIVKGSIYALGKLNGEWIGITVQKQ